VKIGTYTTESNGQVKIPNGLKAGRYRLKETLTVGQQKNYITMYTGENDLWRYFTVGSTPSTVNVYNPEKPDLTIEKTTWAGDPSIGLDGITFTIQKSGSSEIKAATVKLENGKYAASFKNLDSGVYTIKAEALGSGAAQAVTSGYFETATVNVGYEAKASGEKVSLVPVGDSVTGKLAAAVVKNPRLSDLIIHKTDAETKESGTGMAGASFKVEYLKFRTGSDLIGGVLQNVTDVGYKKP
ncbi:hypothetical protein, partial [Lacrimispora sp.]|uniref:hypothetical protein n=1 Tax=Lacrimispora sp. TaxID=2719234 RepID=UPI0028B15C1D